MDAILLRQRLLCYLRPGAGKTLTAFAVFLRLKFSVDSSSLNLHSGVCLVVTEANLVSQVWIRQSHDHGVHIDDLHDAKDPGHGKQFFVVSFQTLAVGTLRTCLDMEAGTLWGRKIVALIIDEVQNKK